VGHYSQLRWSGRRVTTRAPSEPKPARSLIRQQAGCASETDSVESQPSDQLSELAYYYPEPYWLAGESSWIKSLLLFFDGVAILLPDYMSGRELTADPTLAEPLTDQGLLKVLQPEWFVDEELADRLAEGMVELIVGGSFDQPESRAPDMEDGIVTVQVL